MKYIFVKNKHFNRKNKNRKHHLMHFGCCYLYWLTIY